MLTLLLQTIRDWVVSTFVRKNNGGDTKAIIGRYNVLDYGLKNDGSIDCSTALQNLIDSIQYSDMGAVLFFPKGLYLFNSPIVLKNHISLVGETRSKMRNASPTQNQGDSVLKFVPSAADQTFITRVQPSKFVEIYGLTFFAATADDTPTYRVNKLSDSDTWDNTFPFKLYPSETLLSGINGVDLIGDSDGGGGMVTIRNCHFYGFSGFACGIPKHKHVNDCTFFNCNEGVRCYGTDSILENNWWCRCGVAIHCTSYHSPTFTNLEVNNCWADQLSEHFIVCDVHNTNGTPTDIVLLINNAWVDMVEGCAILVEGRLKNSRISGRFSRIGMSYADSTDSYTVTNATKKESDFIVCGGYLNNNIDVSCFKRGIAQGPRKNDSTAVCPRRLISLTGELTTANGFSYNGNIKANKVKTDMPKAYIYGNNPNLDLISEGENLMGVVSTDNNFYQYPNVAFRTRSPYGLATPPKAGLFAYDTNNMKLWLSTGTTKNDWVTSSEPTTAEATTLQANTDFTTEVQSEIADSNKNYVTKITDGITNTNYYLSVVNGRIVLIPESSYIQ